MVWRRVAGPTGTDHRIPSGGAVGPTTVTWQGESVIVAAVPSRHLGGRPTHPDPG